MDLQEHNQNILCQKDSFLCAALGTNVSIAFQKDSVPDFLEGRVLFFKTFRDGKAFVHAGGTVVRKQLQGETLRVDTARIVAFEESITYDVQMAGG